MRRSVRTRVAAPCHLDAKLDFVGKGWGSHLKSMAILAHAFQTSNGFSAPDFRSLIQNFRSSES